MLRKLFGFTEPAPTKEQIKSASSLQRSEYKKESFDYVLNLIVENKL